jgi:hypothetical protein
VQFCATFLQASVALALTAFLSAANAQPYFTLDPATGNYNFIYQKQDGSGTATGVFIPGNKLAFPSVRSTFTLSGVDTVIYRYAVANSSAATIPIQHIHFDGIAGPLVGEIMPMANETIAQIIARGAAASVVMLAPPAWSGYTSRGVRSGVPTSRVSWGSDDDLSQIQPGGELSGLGFSSLDLPGLALLTAVGYPNITYSDPDGFDDNDPVYRQLWDLEDATYPTVNAAAPVIAVPSPYDAAATLENIQTHVHTLITKQLLDTAFSAQLDTSFQAAISAYRSSQPLVAKVQLEIMRTLIQQQQPDADKDAPVINLAAPPALIDLLAARILYFDLGYVINRMGV